MRLQKQLRMHWIRAIRNIFTWKKVHRPVKFLVFLTFSSSMMPLSTSIRITSFSEVLLSGSCKQFVSSRPKPTNFLKKFLVNQHKKPWHPPTISLIKSTQKPKIFLSMVSQLSILINQTQILRYVTYHYRYCFFHTYTQPLTWHSLFKTNNAQLEVNPEEKQKKKCELLSKNLSLIYTHTHTPRMQKLFLVSILQLVRIFPFSPTFLLHTKNSIVSNSRNCMSIQYSLLFFFKSSN